MSINSVTSSEKVKRKYTPPHITTILLNMENVISATSAIINPRNADDDLTHEWEIGTDRETDITW